MPPTPVQPTISAPSASEFPRPADPAKPEFHPYALGPQPPGSVPLVFDPTPEELASVFRALSDPYQSLFEVAANHNTTLPALTAWMARPDVAAALDSLESAGARHARVCAINELPHAANALSCMAQSYTHAEDKVPLAPNTEARTERRRHAENTRRACWLLFRIVRFYAGLPRSSPVSPITRSPVVADATPSAALSPAPRGRDAEAPRGREGASHTTTQDPDELKSLPPLHTVADVLQTLLKQAAATARHSETQAAPVAAISATTSPSVPSVSSVVSSPQPPLAAVDREESEDLVAAASGATVPPTVTEHSAPSPPARRGGSHRIAVSPPRPTAVPSPSPVNSAALCNSS